MAMLKSDGKMVFMIFVGAVITVVFMGVIADQVFLQTNTATATNVTFTAAAVNSSVTLTGRQNISTITVINATNATLDWSANFTVDTVDSSSNLGIFLVTRDVTGVGFAGESINVSYDYQPVGYLQDSGARSIAALVVIMSALAIVVFVIVVMFKFGSIRDMMASFNRRRSR